MESYIVLGLFCLCALGFTLVAIVVLFLVGLGVKLTQNIDPAIETRASYLAQKEIIERCLTSLETDRSHYQPDLAKRELEGLADICLGLLPTNVRKLVINFDQDIYSERSTGTETWGIQDVKNYFNSL